MTTFNKTKASVLQENIGDAEKYYGNYCASCHGKQVKAFVDREKWVYGSTRSEMFDVVKHGAEADGMPAYGEVLLDQQVYALVDYILAAIEDKKSEDFNTGANEDVVFVSEGMRLRLELVADNLTSPWAITQSQETVRRSGNLSDLDVDRVVDQVLERIQRTSGRQGEGRR